VNSKSGDERRRGGCAARRDDDRPGISIVWWMRFVPATVAIPDCAFELDRFILGRRMTRG
jgi:hypothetical protein